MKSLARFWSVIESALIFGTVAAVVGCGSGEPTSSNDPTAPPPTTPPTTTTPPPTMPPPGDPPTMPPPMPPPPMPPPLGEWETLLAGDWTMAPGSEGYVCVRKTVDKDLIIGVFDAINPPGTHHTLLTMGTPDAPDGTTACNAGVNRTQSVFGSGVGNVPLAFPSGVAFRMKAGTQLLLNLHLFNTGTAPISGTSGTKYKTIAEADAPVIAEGLLAGTTSINLPPGQSTTSTGYCTMSIDSTLFAVSQHMHLLGTYEKIVVEHAAGGEAMLYEGPYKFDEQRYYTVGPVDVKKGDRVRVECTHNNTTASRVTFGESTLSEMCFAGLYRFPSDGSNFMCIR
jgi:hypothetical protein